MSATKLCWCGPTITGAHYVCSRCRAVNDTIPAPPPQATKFDPAGLPLDSAARKATPMCTGLLDYFPAALAAVAAHSKQANDKHNPGEPMHWARGKSMDHADCIIRHLAGRGGFDPTDGARHATALAWRALALLQEELEAEGAPLPRAAKKETPK